MQNNHKDSLHFPSSCSPLEKAKACGAHHPRPRWHQKPCTRRMQVVLLCNMCGLWGKKQSGHSTCARGRGIFLYSKVLDLTSYGRPVSISSTRDRHSGPLKRPLSPLSIPSTTEESHGRHTTKKTTAESAGRAAPRYASPSPHPHPRRRISISITTTPPRRKTPLHTTPPAPAKPQPTHALATQPHHHLGTLHALTRPQQLLGGPRGVTQKPRGVCPHLILRLWARGNDGTPELRVDGRRRRRRRGGDSRTDHTKCGGG